MSTVMRLYGYILNHPKTKRGYWGVWYFSERYTKTLNIMIECGSALGSLVEIGCGRGLYAYHLRKLKPDCDYVGCDFDRVGLNEAFKGRNISYVLCDARMLPIRDNSVDVVLCSEVLEHLSSPYEVLASATDLSRKIVLVTFPIEHLENKINARHPEHIFNIKLRKVINRLESKNLKILKAGEISRFFIPCGILEFLRVPKNRFTMLLVKSIDLVFRTLLPITFVPDQTILVVAAKGENQLLNKIDLSLQ